MKEAKMEVRLFTEEDHKEVCGWWKSHKWGEIPLAALPKTAIIAYENGVNICAGFLYKTDSTFCVLEFIVGNPNASKEQRAEGVDSVVEALVTLAKGSGHNLIFSSVKHPTIVKTYEKHGFVASDGGMTNFVRSF